MASASRKLWLGLCVSLFVTVALFVTVLAVDCLSSSSARDECRSQYLGLSGAGT